MSLNDRMQILDKAIEVLDVTNQLISTRSDGTTSEFLVIDQPFVLGLYFGLVGAKKLIDGDSVGNTELEFVNIMAANYALMLDAIGAAEFKQTDSVKEHLDSLGIEYIEALEPDASHSGDDAS